MLHTEDSNDNFILYNSDFNIEITLDRSLSVSDTFVITLYNDQMMLLDYRDSDDNIKHKGKKMNITFWLQSLWMPGNYFVIIRDLTKQVIIRFDLVLDHEGKFTVSEPRQCPALSDEDVLSGNLYLEKAKWQHLSLSPGFMQIRRWIINRQKVNVLNDYRKQFDLKDIQVSGNMLIAIRSKFYIGLMLLLNHAAGINDEIVSKNCREFFDKSLANPYEFLSTCFTVPTTEHFDKHYTFVFKNIAALNENGGKRIVNYMLDHWPNNGYVVLEGSQEDIDTLLNENPSLQDRFPKENRIAEEPFTKEEILCNIFDRIALSALKLSRDGAIKAYNMLTSAYDKGQTASWTNADIRQYIGMYLMPTHARNSVKHCQETMTKDNCFVTSDDVEESLKAYLSKSGESSLTELNGMIGLSEIKQRITTFSNRLRFYNERRQLGLPTNDGTTYHAVFTGNPGTGKTTVARMLGKIYHSLGLLSKGDVISVDRTRIVGRYIGETEENMAQLLKEARGNILFIDEAYTLYNEDDDRDFGRHAIETLLTVLSRKDPDMVIIFAGYEKEMDALLKMNPGLAGRFPYKLHFPDYSAPELMQIALSLLAKEQYELTPEASTVLEETISNTVAHRTPTFANARWIEQYIRNGIIPALADRLMTSPHVYDRTAYQRIEAADVRNAYGKFNPRVTELRPRRVIGFNA